MSLDAEDKAMDETPPTGHAGSHAESHGAAGEPGWLEQPGSVDKIIWALCIASALSVFADLFYHKHGHWHFQELFGFDAFYGFVACVGLVLAAKGMRLLLMRSEDYYD